MHRNLLSFILMLVLENPSEERGFQRIQDEYKKLISFIFVSLFGLVRGLLFSTNEFSLTIDNNANSCFRPSFILHFILVTTSILN